MFINEIDDRKFKRKEKGICHKYLKSSYRCKLSVIKDTVFITRQVCQPCKILKIPVFDIKFYLHKFSYLKQVVLFIPTVYTRFAYRQSIYHFACWVKNSADDILKYFSHFSQKICFDILCKLSPKETICIECQSIFFVKK